MAPNEILGWLNLILTLGGFVSIYIKIVDRMARIETHQEHIMNALDLRKRASDTKEEAR